MKSYEKLTDTLDGKVLDLNFKILVFLAAVLVRPLACCTQVMFRKNLGDRYFNTTTCVYSFFLWGIPSFFARREETRVHWDFIREHGWPRLATWLAGKSAPETFGVLLGAAFSLSAMRNLIQARNRQAANIAWYSMSRGESVFGQENPLLSSAVSLAIIVVLAIFAKPYAIFFLVSRIADYYLYQKEQASIYARYQDEMDARILANQLEPALNGKKQPRETEGLCCPLPGRFKGEHRAEVARVSASLMARSASRRETADQSSGTASPTSASISIQGASPTLHFSPETKAKVTSIAVNGAKRLFRLLILFIILGLAAIIIYVAGSSLFRLVKSQPKPPAAVVVSPQVSTPVAKPTVTQISAPVVQRSPLEGIRNAVTPIPDEPKNVPRSAAQASEIPPAAASVNIATDLIVSDKFKIDQTIEQITALVAAEVQKVSEFKSRCTIALDMATNRVAKVPSRYRAALRKQIASIHDAAEPVIKSDELLLDDIQGILPSYATKQQTELQTALEIITAKFTAMEADRQIIQRGLDHLNEGLAAAEKKKGILFFK